MSYLSKAFKILADLRAPDDQNSVLHELSKLLPNIESSVQSNSISVLSGQLSTHYNVIDTSSINQNNIIEAEIPISDDSLANYDSFFASSICSESENPNIYLKCEKKVDIGKLFSNSNPPPIETTLLTGTLSSQCAKKDVPAPVYSQSISVSIEPLANRSGGVKRLGGFRPPVVLPPTQNLSKESEEPVNDVEDDEYEPDPKIRARKQWRKQYEAAKKKEADRKYNTPKYRDDSGPKENNGPGFCSDQLGRPAHPGRGNFQPPSQVGNSNQPARQMGNRPGFRPASKFVPPLIRKNDDDQSQQRYQTDVPGVQANVEGSIKHNFIKTALNDGAEFKEPQDERLKNLDPAMIEMIMSEIVDDGPKLEWEDVAGLGTVKKNIMEVIVWPMIRPGIRGPPKGLLLFGPPGTGKTMIGKCIASQCNATFFSISASSLLSKWFGEAEKMVRTLFAVARTKQPAVIFIDEIDSMLCKRGQDDQECSRRIKTEFLVQLDGVTCGENDRILMIGATNLPNELDEAARRRFGKRLYVSLPNQEARVQMVKRLMCKMDAGQWELSEEDYNEIANFSEGYSGSDMNHLCREASLGPLRSITDIASVNISEIRPVMLEDFKSAFRTVRPSVAPNDLTELEQWNRQYGTINTD